MDRLVAALTRWGALGRRALSPSLPPLARRALPVALLLLVAAGLLRDLAYYRSLPGPIANDDVFAYECYARAFWRGTHALVDSPITRFCADHRWRFWTAPPRAFHTLPLEYPAPALGVFSLPLLVPGKPYDQTYMVLMACLTFASTCWLLARRLLLCAAAFALYVLVAGWATALARYDLVPGLLVMISLVLAERRRWLPAYLILAAATLLKIYPGFFAPALAIHQWRATGRPPLREAGAFALAVAAGLLPGALLNPGGFVGPLRYNGVRPPQIESVAGSLLWLSGKIGGAVRVRLTYHSLNVTGVLAGLAAWLATAALLAGLALVFWRSWRGRDDLARSFVLVGLVTLAGSKLLSPQYLLWLLPLAAYVEGLRLRWALLAGLTLLIYPNAYNLGNSLVLLPEHPLFMTAILARNALLLGLAVAYLRPFRTASEIAADWRGATHPSRWPRGRAQPIAPDGRERLHETA